MTVRLLEGHVVDVLAAQPANHWHVCVTSPPYLWLRSYSTVPQVWEDGWVGELGQEPSPELYVAHLVAVFRAVKRVLRADGTLWVNISGSFFNDPGGQNGAGTVRNGTGMSTLTGANTKNKTLHAISQKAVEANATLGRQKRGRHPWLKPLDWVDVPGLFACAMQQDGWTWRSDVIWLKPSALPESVSGTRFERCRVKTAKGKTERRGASPTADGAGYASHGDSIFDDGSGYGSMTAEWADCTGCPKCAANEGLVLRRGSGRPTKTHEHIHLYTKGPGYFYDAEAVREPNTEGSIARFADDPHRVENKKYAGTAGISPAGMNATEWRGNGRNLRDVWTISPEPLADQHYAAFPSRLPERCILAGTSEWGCCPSCGAPFARVVETPPEYQALLSHKPHQHEFDLEAFRIYLRECREAKGLSRSEVDEALGTNTAYAWWEGRNYYGEFRQQVPTADLYERLKALLGMDGRFDAAHARFRVSETAAVWNAGGAPLLVGRRAPPAASRSVRLLGWRPTCRCPGVAEQAPVPARVLDPFSGSGTTLLAANRLGRDATGIDLKPQYNALARKRLGREPLSLFAWQGQEALAAAGEEAPPLETTKQTTLMEDADELEGVELGLPRG